MIELVADRDDELGVGREAHAAYGEVVALELRQRRETRELPHAHLRLVARLHVHSHCTVHSAHHDINLYARASNSTNTSTSTRDMISD